MYEIVHHTADLRLNVGAPSLEELFRESLRAMTDCMRPAGIGQPAQRTITVQAPDATALLVDFLNEVLWLAHVHHEVFERAEFRVLAGTHLEAALSGHRAAEFGEDIKAVTYHEADIVQTGAGQWRTTLVFDI